MPLSLVLKPKDFAVLVRLGDDVAGVVLGYRVLPSDITWLGTNALNSLPALKQGTRWALRRLWAMNLQEAREA